MPAEPKRRHSKARKRTRRAAIKLVSLGLIKCSHCKELTPSHQVCQHCGFYQGRQVKRKTNVQVVKA